MWHNPVAAAFFTRAYILYERSVYTPRACLLATARRWRFPINWKHLKYTTRYIIIIIITRGRHQTNVSFSFFFKKKITYFYSRFTRYSSSKNRQSFSSRCNCGATRQWLYKDVTPQRQQRFTRHFLVTARNGVFRISPSFSNTLEQCVRKNKSLDSFGLQVMRIIMVTNTFTRGGGG